MLEKLSKTSLFTLCNHQTNKQYNKNNSVWFSSVNVKAKSFTSSSLYLGNKMGFGGIKEIPTTHFHRSFTVHAQMKLRIGNVQKWWEKGLQPNMKEVTCTRDFVDSLLSAGDKLVVVDFYSPGCGGCKALHPKICQFAEMNPDVQFLQVNYEEHKSMCYSLSVHVLPFFRFYRGADGRLCSFSCTNATIKKFKDALAKHTPDRSSIGPTKGLEEKELIALAANKDLLFEYVPKPAETLTPPACEKIGAGASSPNSESDLFNPLVSTTFKSAKNSEDNLVMTER